MCDGRYPFRWVFCVVGFVDMPPCQGFIETATG